MGTLGEKAGTFILTAIQVANDTKRMVEERVKGLVKEAMADHEAEVSKLRERLEDVERLVRRGAKEPERKDAGTPARPKKRRGRKKAAKAPECSFPGCGNRHMAKGLCKNHYYQLKRGSIVKTATGYEAAKPKPDAPAEAANPAATQPDPSAPKENQAQS
ncbi:MAG: hypothetical protein HY897_03900 [Deltaproteobacteria bacterium]|nr:hypothetical protein [Deltaproteobacteria bacterium]